MGLHARSVNDSLRLASFTKGEVSWSTTEEPFTSEEEDAIVTLVVVVIGIIVAIVVLFLMGIFIDCKHQKKNVSKKKLKLKMPPLSHARRRNEKEDAKSLASNMCPTGASDADFRTRDAIV
ncbi:PREDICTED: uncharacterized protein LOC108571383 [Habropoda laboriosa]|uniref:uncharacterized protein LOC108571383 n=1 Tax=Habropoda laboriosa TaxID=597456 RepID=UPI00083D034D|nr:PREDICTED: uncharacterized protein LOC108571383 [Habropoda laboriosa]